MDGDEKDPYDFDGDPVWHLIFAMFWLALVQAIVYAVFFIF